MIEISIDTTQALRSNLVFKIPEANVDGCFDLYYFGTSDPSKQHLNPLQELVNYWINKSSEINVNELGYLPIDFSDEYIGCLKIERVTAEEFKLSYGFSRIPGYGIDPADPGDFFIKVNDFEFDRDTNSIIVKR